MKVILKKPGLPGEVIEVSGIQEINKMVGNVDSEGNGYDHGGSDIRMSIGKNVDMYVKEDALTNASLEANLWAPGDMALFAGNIIFAGYDQDSYENSGACSLTDEQIQYCLDFISLQTF